MPLSFATAAPGSTIDALAATIDDAKGGDRLAPVVVVVPTNVSGVMARRALGRQHGVLGVDMVTLNRLAELMGGPILAAQRRRPVSSPVLELTVRRVLDDDPGAFGRVAHHPSTVTALREAHEELRLAGPGALDALAEYPRGRQVARVSRAVTRVLASRWYDEADLFEVASEQLGAGRSTVPGTVVLHLPDPLRGLPLAFVQRLAEHADVTVVSCLTGDVAADAAPVATLDALGAPPDARIAPELATPPSNDPLRVVSVTDADDEATTAVRLVVDAARGELTGAPVPFERIAVLWSAHQPYARLVEHHLASAEIPWNGRGGTELSERLAPRLLLDLLDLDRRGIRRRPLFELLADVPARRPDGSFHPTAAWERVSRLAGVSDDADWTPRLRSLARDERWRETAMALSDFVDELRTSLGPRSEPRPWRTWVDWCADQLERWLGKGAIARLSDADYRAWEALMAALERVRCLDEISEPVTRPAFRAVLEAELDASGVRDGRIGTGVSIGSLASAAGLDVDVTIVLGAADGLLPPAPRGDPLLSDADRARCGLATSDARAERLHHQFRCVVQGGPAVVTRPRGDLRATTEHHPSRWLSDLPDLHTDTVASFAAGLTDVAFPPSERERRLGGLLGVNRSHGPGALLAPEAGTHTDPLLDPAFTRRATMRSARERDALTEFDGDLSRAGVPPVADGVVSPTQIELWAACPHAYFVTHLLGVRPVDEPDAQISISALDRGLVQHEALDRFHHDVIDGRLPQPAEGGWTDAHRESLLAHFEAVCDRYESMGRAGRPATWAGERARMRADLLGWLAHDSEVSRLRGVTILDSEHRFPADDESSGRPTHVTLPLPDGRALAVKGSIDRLDRAADGTLVVTDHKTGKDDAFRKLSADDPTLGGTKFQLATYAAAAVARFHENPPVPDGDAAVGDTVPVRSEYSMFARGQYRRIGYEAAPEVWQAVVDELGTVVAGIEAGWFPQLPERPGFRMWPSCWFCEPDGLGTAEAWHRWTVKRHDPRIERWFGDPDVDADAHGGPGGVTNDE